MFSVSTGSCAEHYLFLTSNPVIPNLVSFAMFLKKIDCPTVKKNILVTNANKKVSKMQKSVFSPQRAKSKKCSNGDLDYSVKIMPLPI